MISLRGDRRVRAAGGRNGEPRFNPGQDLALGLSPIPGSARSFPARAAFSSCGQCGDAKFLPDQGDFLRTQTGNLQPVGQAGRHFFFEFFQELQFAGAQQLVDLFGDGLTHAGNVFEFAFFPVFVDVAAQLRQVFGGFAVGQGFVDDFALDLR